MTSWEATIELSCGLVSGIYSDYSLPDLDSRLAFSLLLNRKWSLALSFPFLLSAWAAGTSTVPLVPGDISMAAGIAADLGDSRLYGSCNLTAPSGRWQAHQEVPGSVAAGSGRWTLGLSGGISRIIDPVLLTGFLSWSLGLPVQDRWNRLWRPGDFSLILSLTEVFNELVSFTLGVSQYVSLPERIWEPAELLSWPGLTAESLAYDAKINLEFQFSGRSFTLGLGFSKGLVYASEPGSVNLALIYVLKRKEEK